MKTITSSTLISPPMPDLTPGVRSRARSTGSSPRLWRGLRVWAPALVMVATAWLAAPASAQTSVLDGSAGSTYVPTIVQSYINGSFSTLSGLVAHDAAGNDAIANGSLATPGGEFRLSSHACSGGGPGFGGQASANAHASITLDYRIVSATLPAGTPVSVFVRWAVNGRATALGQDMIGSNTGASAIADAHVAIAPNYANAVNKVGSYSRSTSTSGEQIIRSGALKPDGDSGEYVYVMQVGQIIRVFVEGSAGSNSSVEAGTTDGDAQFVALWGVSSLDPNASVVLNSNPGEPAPPADQATPERAIELLDPRPAGLLPCFQIVTQPLGADTCSTYSATYSVAAQGSGPFTYQWRKDGVPIDSAANPSAATTTLQLLDLAPADAVTYDVVVSNACGDIVSDGVTLAVCPAGSAVPERLALALRSYPNPFNPRTEVAFALPGAGAVDLAVFDLRGALVKVLHRGQLEAGEHAITWDGRNERGSAVGSGVYLVRLKTTNGDRTVRVTLLE